MAANTASVVRLKLAVRGAVQGVGFRPFVFRLAEELGLTGWVNNSPRGVSIEVEGARKQLESFLLRLEREKPPRSFIQSLEATWLDALDFKQFEIRPSSDQGPKTALVLPDIATCPDCRHDISEPGNRRYRYPFTNCTHCGPRFSIIESLPYDRANTAMKAFTMCPECQAEYDNPHDRRFHAQPNACPACGPQLELWNPAGDALFGGHQALLAAVAALRRGRIVAVKGIGGFHLLADARNETAVQRLRDRKQRSEKPFALMFPSFESVQVACEVSPLEERLLRSPEAPIVLLRHGKPAPGSAAEVPVAGNVAPGNPYWGVMLPSNPLQHLLLAALNFPVIATSGNLSEEPMCVENRDALARLGHVADLFLMHNRPIVRHADDSIVRVILDREIVLRRARGYAPLPVTLTPRLARVNARPILAVGGQMKNSIALSLGSEVFISQHIGDLDAAPAGRAFRRVITDFEKLYAVRPETVASDLHPDYFGTKFAGKLNVLRHTGVQHHVAHVLSCMTENDVAPPALGVAWDGTGFGPDGTIWGGEFFLVAKNSCERVAHLRPFRLPGGEKAVQEPRRAALGLLYQMSGDEAFRPNAAAAVAAFSPAELTALRTMLKNKINSPLTSSMGRLFDAVASLAGLRHTTGFEGQAAMDLEFALEGVVTDQAYSLALVTCQEALVLDWSGMIEMILADVTNGVSPGLISAKFHNALAEAIVATAKSFGMDRVVLSGGCFQNRYLTERVVRQLQAEHFKPYWHQRVPTNDGGLALGQIAGALRAQMPGHLS